MARVDISELDFGKLIEVGTRIFSHITGAHVVALCVIGDRLGLFETIADHGPLTSHELAGRAGLNERYVREWANALVATSYLEMDADDRYFMTKELVFQLGDPGSPGTTIGAHQLAYGVMSNVPRLLQAFREGGGIGYAEIGEEVTVGVERLWAPMHEWFLEGWLDSIPGLAERLRAGATIADVGCGRGRSTVSLARLFPRSTVVGIDMDPASIDSARELARARGVEQNTEFRVQPADEIADRGRFDFVYLFHTLHDIAEPVPALAAIREALAGDGLLLCVESAASADPRANRGTPAELFSSISPLFNLPVAMASGSDGPGTVLSDAAMAELATKAGFGSYEAVSITFPPPSMLHHFHVMRP